MALSQFTPTVITMDVSDRTLDSTVFKQRATFTALHHAQTAGVSTATVVVRVDLFSSLDGDYGQPLTGAGLHSYNYELRADNNTIVNAETGEQLYNRTGETDAEWTMLAVKSEHNTMFQGDFFELLREQPVKIADLIRQHIANADALGRFK